jgi:hypothetical protein
VHRPTVAFRMLSMLTCSFASVADTTRDVASPKCSATTSSI